jgi:hypothetical protein
MSKRDHRFSTIEAYEREVRHMSLEQLEREYMYQEFNPERRAALRKAIAEAQQSNAHGAPPETD